MGSPGRSLLPWALGLLAVAAVVAGLVLWALPASSPGVEVLLPTPTAPPELAVYVSGAVARPGVYQLEEGDRLADALAAAGGPTAEADLWAVNQALRVTDEAHFHVPRIGEPPRPSITAPSGTAPSGGAPAGRLNINLAEAEALEELPNIGQARARAIVAYRQQHGDFAAPSEIMQVDGIGPGIFESLRDLISVR